MCRTLMQFSNIECDFIKILSHTMEAVLTDNFRYVLINVDYLF